MATKYISGISCVEYQPTYDYTGEYVEYASPLEKYKEWDFFIMIIFPFFRVKRASERLWRHKHVSCPTKDQLYTRDELRRHEHILVDYDVANQRRLLYKQASIRITLPDGTYETLWYDTDEEAEEKLAKIVKDYDLKWFDTGFYKGGKE